MSPASRVDGWRREGTTPWPRDYKGKTVTG